MTHLVRDLRAHSCYNLNIGHVLSLLLSLKGCWRRILGVRGFYIFIENYYVLDTGALRVLWYWIVHFHHIMINCWDTECFSRVNLQVRRVVRLWSFHLLPFLWALVNRSIFCSVLIKLSELHTWIEMPSRSHRTCFLDLPSSFEFFSGRNFQLQRLHGHKVRF